MKILLSQRQTEYNHRKMNGKRWLIVLFGSSPHTKQLQFVNALSTLDFTFTNTKSALNQMTMLQSALTEVLLLVILVTIHNKQVTNKRCC